MYKIIIINNVLHNERILLGYPAPTNKVFIRYSECGTMGEMLVTKKEATERMVAGRMH